MCIGLVWRKICTGKQCQFEDVTTASHTLGHPCLVTLLFMASLYIPHFFYSQNFIFTCWEVCEQALLDWLCTCYSTQVNGFRVIPCNVSELMGSCNMYVWAYADNNHWLTLDGLHNQWKNTEVQTLGELLVHGTSNWWAIFIRGLHASIVACGESDPG